MLLDLAIHSRTVRLYFRVTPQAVAVWKKCIDIVKARGLYPAPEPLFTPKPRRKKGEPIPPAAEAAGRGLWPFVHYVREQAGADRDRFLALLSEGREQAGGRAGAALRRQFRDALKACNTWDLWAAAYIMNGGCSDDGFLYFRAWLIMQGQDIVERAIADPDSLADAELRYFEDDAAEAEDVLEVLLDDTDPPGGRPRGAKFSEDGEHLRARLPRLAAKYMT